ncbi:MAG TPA: HD domain-containing phosphohydrolase [Candidatus Acidoferrales bacterium]|nr:HD domain-containing phosphohydrolase [Candidatus Acidoferrales bacterium]
MDLTGERRISNPSRRAVGRTVAVCGDRTTLVKEIAPAPDLNETEKPAFRSGETESMLLSLAKIVEQRDNHTAGHCERLAFTAVALGVAMRLDSGNLLALYLGGYLHDLGKVGIPDSILFKRGRLSNREWETMRTHPARGEEICRPLRSLRSVLPLIRHHHERLDGTGYPDGLRGNAVPLLARVLQVVDIYDALTNPRPYKNAYARPKALQILEEEADRGWRDREVTQLFVRLNQQVHSRIAAYRPGPGDGAVSMSRSLANLQRYLEQ